MVPNIILRFWRGVYLLIQIEIKDFAIIEHSIINFEDGFNVITGETGAGKSILLDALSCIVGGRSNKSFIRKGKEQAEIKAVFLKSDKIQKKLDEKNICIDDDVVIIKRIISANGRSMAKINGSIHTTQTIKEICQDSIEICGQKAHLDLLNEDRYLSMIDAHLDQKTKHIIKEYQTDFLVYKELKYKLSELSNQEREQEQLLDMYRFQKEEIEKMNLEIGEDETLEQEEKFLSSFEKISQNINRSVSSLSAIDEIYNAKEHLHTASIYQSDLHPIVERLEKAYYELEDIRRDAENYLDGIEYDEERLNEIVVRLDTIKHMKRKYADSIGGILEHYDFVSEKIDDFTNKETRILEIQKELAALEKKLTDIADRLHQARIKISKEMNGSIIKVLQDLCMPDASFEFEVTNEKELGRFGFSKVRILFNANKGEDSQPLSKIASGGELSRVLLAMKIGLNQDDEADTIIFDEVDEGVGGEVGRVIGQKLYELGKDVQLIVISHLPQVAAKANRHLLIQKTIKENRTISTVDELGSEERIKEIARMIYGDEMNDITLQQAKEMLKKK